MNSSPKFDIESLVEIPSNRDFYFLTYFMRKFMRYLGVFATASMLAAFSFVFIDFVNTRNVFPPKTFIGNIDVSNLSTEEAFSKIQTAGLYQAFSSQITLEADNLSFTFSPEALGLEVLVGESVNSSFNLVHKANYLEELKERVIKEETSLPLILSVDKSRLLSILAPLAPQILSTPKDASIILYEETGGYNIEAEELGRTLNLEKSLAAFSAALNKGEKVVKLAINYTYPKIREKDLRPHPPAYRLSAFTTYYGRHDSPNRIHNIKLISSWLNNTLIMPGESFSLANTIGDFTPERGFKEAYVIMSGELVPQYGGGTCQIGTTLFNVVSLADLKILQRRNHSFYFNIYPLGRDATVYPGQVDFRFQNDSGYPLLIKTVATNRKLSFRIYGTLSGKVVKFSSPSVYGLSATGYVPMSLGQVIARDVPFKTSVIRTVYDKDGNIIKEETVHSSYKLYGEKTNVPIRRLEPR